MSGGLRVCRKCLLRGESGKEYFENLRNYIASLDDDVRVEQEIYEERLHKCAQCAQLLNGMCRLCGCYVELRAAIRVRKCPAMDRQW